MSTRENIRLIARAPLNYREVDKNIKKKDYYKFFFPIKHMFLLRTQNIIFYG